MLSHTVRFVAVTNGIFEMYMCGLFINIQWITNIRTGYAYIVILSSCDRAS